MKKLFLIGSVVIASFYSCSNTTKTDINPKTVITATIDGVTEDFNVQDSVRKNGTTGMYFSGTNATTKDKLRIYLGSSTGFGAGNYYSPQPGKSGGSAEIMFFPGGSEADGYYTYYTTPYGSDPGFQYFGSVTVNNYSSSLLDGTFGASVVAFSSVTPGANNPIKIKTITNGKFSILLNP